MPHTGSIALVPAGVPCAACGAWSRWAPRARSSAGTGSGIACLLFAQLEPYTPQGYISAMRTGIKAPCLKRLKRIEGQVRGLARMVEADRYCIDIVTQIAAVRAALRRVEEEVLRDHVAHCVEHAVASGSKAEQRRKIAELMDVLSRAER